jgi:CheY-like chemotaxis protein
LVRPSVSGKIELRLDLERDLPAFEADRGQVQQVFTNLVLNAAEAMGGQEGLVTVRTGVQEVEEGQTELQSANGELPAGRYVFLEVRDTGCGIDEAIQARMFDPFFSTKFVGRGLGLAAVAGIARGHNGAVRVTSAPGKGSCFRVLFPARARGPAAADGQPSAHGSLRGSGTILVVDDEEAVRTVVKKALARYGYEVLVAESGTAAIQIVTQHPGELAAVILDLSMPGMSGEEVLPELRRIRPALKVLISSGYSEIETMQMFRGQQIAGFIQKPHTPRGLAEMLKVCLG